MNTFKCSQCGQEKQLQQSGGTGYAKNNAEELICYACCAVNDREEMIKTGASRSLPLYLSTNPMQISNWPGTLVFKPKYHKQGGHNIAKTREDVWFDGPDGFVWHGAQYGEWSQICHCKRTKEKVSHV